MIVTALAKRFRAWLLAWVVAHLDIEEVLGPFPDRLR